MKVLVTGGTGVVGKAAVDRLLEHGHTVRLLSRHAADDARQWQAGVEPHPGDVSTDAAVAGAAEGCDAVLHVAGIVAENPPEATFQTVNVDGTRRLAKEAGRAGVRRFVYVSSLGAEGGDSGYHRSKHDAEIAVREEAPPGWLIVRPGNVYGPGDEVISLLLRMVRTLPAVPTVGWGQQPFQPVWVDDLAEALVAAVTRTEPSRSIVDIAGPEVTTTREIVDLLSEITGRSPVSIPVPEPIVQFGAWAAEALGLDAPVNQDQITMLLEGNVIPEGRSNGLTEVFGVTPTPLREGLKKLADALPEQLPRDGSGSLQRQRYWADIQGSRLSADRLFEIVQTEFYTLTPDALLRVGAEPGTAKPIEEGATLTLAIPLRGNIQVRCVEVADNTITCVTLEGHPLSGAIRFDVTEMGGAIRFEVRSFTRASGLVDRIGMRTFGHAAQRATWHSVVQAVVERSMGAAPDGVQAEETKLEGRDAEEVENWVEEVVMRFRRKESPSPH